jgi:hypothetical protein
VTSTVTHTSAWPFLVGRGRHEGYRTLLAPGFLVERDMYETLSEATPSVPAGVLGRAEVSCPGLGPLALTYTTERTGPGSGGSANGVGEWTDEHGRPLEMLYGVVAHEPLSDTLVIGDLRQAREDALDSYETFLAHEDDFPVGISRPYPLPRDTPGRYRQHDTLSRLEGARQQAPQTPLPPVARPQPLRPAHAARPQAPAAATVGPKPGDGAGSPTSGREAARRTRRRGRTHGATMVVALAAVMLALGGWLLTRGSTPNVTIVDASATPANSDTCGAATQVSLQATVSASNGVRIRYRWLPTGKQPAESTVTEETITATGTPQTITEIRDASAGPYRLVVDKPVSRQSGPVACRSPQVTPLATSAARRLERVDRLTGVIGPSAKRGDPAMQ